MLGVQCLIMWFYNNLQTSANVRFIASGIGTTLFYGRARQVFFYLCGQNQIISGAYFADMDLFQSQHG